MAAICGFAPAELAGEVAGNDLSPMLAALHDYGETASRWANGGAALGLRSDSAVLGRRIALRTDAEAGLAVAADARLDNRGDLCSAFGLRPSEREDVDDAELALRAFKRWGRDCADRLLGDFAFAVYDERKRELFLARDPVGVRPLYYALGKGRLVFGTSVESVLAAEDVHDELDEIMIADTLTRLYVDDRERTFFRAVRRLPAGHALVFAGGKVRLHRHWRPEKLPRRRPASDDAALEEVLELLDLAVRDRLTGGPVGVELSGGLDSTAVTALTVRQLKREGRPQPFALTLLPSPKAPLPEGHQREYDAAFRVAKSLDLQVRHRDYSVDDMVRRLRADAFFPGRASSGMLPLAKELGVHVLMGGYGGDQGGVSHNGRGDCNELLLRGRLLRFSRIAKERGRSPLRLFALLCLELLHPRLPALMRRLRDRPSPPATPRWLIDPDFAQRVRPSPPKVHRTLGVRRLQLRVLRSGQKAKGLEESAAACAAHGLETRYPMLDRRLLEFALRLPSEYYWRDGEDRWLMRRAIAHLLPEYGDMDPGKRDLAKGAASATQLAQALPVVRQLLEDRATPPERAQYLDMPRLLDQLDADRFLAKPKPALLLDALGILEF